MASVEVRGKRKTEMRVEMWSGACSHGEELRTYGRKEGFKTGMWCIILKGDFEYGL